MRIDPYGPVSSCFAGISAKWLRDLIFIYCSSKWKAWQEVWRISRGLKGTIDSLLSDENNRRNLGRIILRNYMERGKENPDYLSELLKEYSIRHEDREEKGEVIPLVRS